MPWSDTPDAHITTFARQLDRRQVECEDHGITVNGNDKVDHFVDQMSACVLFEAKLLDDSEESAGKSWGETQHHFTNQFNKEQHKLERDNTQKDFDSRVVFQEAPLPHTL